MKDSYLTINQHYQSEIKIKASKFITNLIPIDSIRMAEEELALLRKKFWDANHNCYAFCLDSESFRYSDDGEPSGTAGKPIFDCINGHDLEHILIVVTRYFGGTKLGTGGLIRAYSESVENGISLAEITVHINRARLKLSHHYDQTNAVMHQINHFDIIIIDTIYTESVTVILDIKISETEVFIAKLFDSTNGTVKAEII